MASPDSLTTVLGRARGFHPATCEWFHRSFAAPTASQRAAWPAILDGESTVLFAPTGSGKTLAAFLVEIDRLMFHRESLTAAAGVRVLYISPLKALTVDIERNLRAPLVGIAQRAVERGDAHVVPSVGIRSGDTSPGERVRLVKHPPDILITTPESLFLMLTSRARETLRNVDCVIIDEVHALAGTKRGAHLALSMERLEALRDSSPVTGSTATAAPSLQRIGLSATARPPDEVARFVGGAVAQTRPGGDNEAVLVSRSVRTVDAGIKRALDLTVEVPVEDMRDVAPRTFEGGGAAGPDVQVRTIWTAVHERLVELIRSHRSTMIFVNNRRLAERLAQDINDVAKEELALAHHGSVAAPRRAEIEDKLKRGMLPAIVATSSLELGIDIGAIDLVVQIEAPPGVASGLQRVGRARHQVGATPKGIFMPKFRGDLLSCAAILGEMRDGNVENTFVLRNPLDVLAQHVVSVVAAQGEVSCDSLFALVRRSAPFVHLTRGGFDGVLDMLSGRYPSDEFAELRPRIVWDRESNMLRARRDSLRLVVTNAGTIPDRGLYGVFLNDANGTSRRVGELDEEMVFEARVGEVFLLGASSWRIEDITHDRVIVSPAPGQPGKMPFWRGDRVGRSAALGKAIGALARKLDTAGADFIPNLESMGLNAWAASNLTAYVADQNASGSAVPTDQRIVVETFRDELGDYRVVVLSPYGAHVHAPWVMAITHRLRGEHALEVDSIVTDDGFALRFPESDEAPQLDWLLLEPSEVEDAVVHALSGSALFAARFRESAARALLLPRRRPDRRSPLWAQRRRAADLLAVASRYGSFPILLEAHRECVADVFDLEALRGLMQHVRDGSVQMHAVDAKSPSPFASAVLFNWVGSFVYEGDAPLAERRAQLLSLDLAQLRELLGSVSLREALDMPSIALVETRLQRLDPDEKVDHVDNLHDLLRRVGDLSLSEVAIRTSNNVLLTELLRERRAMQIRVAGEDRVIASEDVGRYRDALGVAPPPGVPNAFLESVPTAVTDLVARYARTHGPFHAQEVATRFGLGVRVVESELVKLMDRGRVVVGEFRPGGTGVEYCDVDVLKSIRRESLRTQRKQIEPASRQEYGRFLLEWHGITKPRRGEEALLRALEKLEGCSLPASSLDKDILAARVEGYEPRMLDALISSGALLWTGVEPLMPNDGRIALYFNANAAKLVRPPREVTNQLSVRIEELLRARGALFFHDIARALGGFQPDLVSALWELVWAGHATNDTLLPLRSLRNASGTSRGAFTSRVLPGTEGRWSLVSLEEISMTERRAATARSLLERHGVILRESVASEDIDGAWTSVYEVLRVMDDAGRARRGYFVGEHAATQFAVPGADDLLRAQRRAEHVSRPEQESRMLAALDPANPWGSTFTWPEAAPQSSGGAPRLARTTGACVVLHDGALVLYAGRDFRSITTFPQPDDPEDEILHSAIRCLCRDARRPAILIAQIDGDPAPKSRHARAFLAHDFKATGRGLFWRAADRFARST